MALDTWLPADVQDELEQAIRDAIAGISQTTGPVLQEVPPPQSPPLNIPDMPALDRFAITGHEGENLLGIEVLFTALPVGDRLAVPDELAMDVDEGEVPFDDAAEPTYMQEVGGPYADLSDALIETLCAYCDVPEMDPTLRFAGDEADLFCTFYAGNGLTSFSSYVAYPHHVEMIYGDGRHDLAVRLGLPA